MNANVSFKAVLMALVGEVLRLVETADPRMGELLPTKPIAPGDPVVGFAG